MVKEIGNHIKDNKDGEGQEISLRFSAKKRVAFKVDLG